MPIISPSILTNDPEQYKKLMEEYQKFAHRVQIDVVDGVFAQNRTIAEDEAWWPDGMIVDMHMMVEKPSEHIDALLRLRPRLVIFHVEAGEGLLGSMGRLREAGIKVGAAFMKTTYFGNFENIIKYVDHVMIFSGDLGVYGGEADLLQLSKVEAIKAIKPNLEIGWDGGANLENVGEIVRAGVDVVTVGSAIAKAENPREAYEKLTTEVNRMNEDAQWLR